ncbi:Predicted neuraminidase (sialidase) [Algoriphagus alkaliphilus]|uniref:Predicted neuraminidase (Sialidase) n=1 Tax=Algoriphagus alkaliphilus TaxID=279824 RepID=A0A1G5WET8_9BACT|nr:sialidase family protein [Algoriphagus alkaliphilus]SDA56047.1 Predicted neuraminidase (sialidase) [Algoriphagus alkaliphilus]
MLSYISFLSLLGLFSFSQKKESPPKILFSGFIYETAPFPSCHASTLLETPDGVMAAWFGGTYERHPDVSIYTSHRKNGEWSIPALAADGIENEVFRNPTWNPVLHRKNDGKIVLFYKEGPNPREWWGHYKVSGDEGKTWSKETQLPPGFLGPVRNKSVELSNGKLLHPSSFETNNVWTSHVEISNPDLTGWEKVDLKGPFNAIQPTALFHPDGKIQLLCRTQEGVVAESWSSDQGKTWTPLVATKLENNNSGIDGVTLADGSHLLVVNPLKKGRNKLVLLGSDDGISWEELLILENEERGEFSYPAIIQAKDGTLHISYTYNREKIKYIHLSL